jgi:penicillin G amidase
MADNVIPTGGGHFTVNVAPVAGNITNTRFRSLFGVTYRQIVDLNDLENSKFILSPGQSGNLLSESYSNLISKWSKSEYLDMKINNYTIKNTLNLNKA